MHVCVSAAALALNECASGVRAQARCLLSQTLSAHLFMSRFHSQNTSRLEFGCSVSNFRRLGFTYAPSRCPFGVLVVGFATQCPQLVLLIPNPERKRVLDAMALLMRSARPNAKQNHAHRGKSWKHALALEKGHQLNQPRLLS